MLDSSLYLKVLVVVEIPLERLLIVLFEFVQGLLMLLQVVFIFLLFSKGVSQGVDFVFKLLSFGELKK
jgi:hypothetical protein